MCYNFAQELIDYDYRSITMHESVLETCTPIAIPEILNPVNEPSIPIFRAPLKPKPLNPKL